MGKENFERALRRFPAASIFRGHVADGRADHLQTVPYNNRLLLYLDKNRTESVKIMELIDDPPPRPKLGGSSRAARSRSRFRAQHNASLGDPVRVLSAPMMLDRSWLLTRPTLARPGTRPPSSHSLHQLSRWPHDDKPGL